MAVTSDQTRLEAESESNDSMRSSVASIDSPTAILATDDAELAALALLLATHIHRTVFHTTSAPTSIVQVAARGKS